MIQRIESLGCVLIRHGGKHDWYQNPQTRVSQPVPRHREINEVLAKADAEETVVSAFEVVEKPCPAHARRVAARALASRGFRAKACPPAYDSKVYCC